MKASEFNQWEGYDKISIPVGKKVVYKLLNMSLDTESGNGAWIISSTNVPPTDTIFREGSIYPIACFTGTQANGDPIYESIVLDLSTAGKLELKSGVPADERKYRYLERSNYNQSNPDRIQDGSKEPIFFRVDEGLDAETELKKDKIKDDAIAKFWEIESNTKLLNDTFEVVGINTEDISVAKRKLREYATQKPKEFLEIFNKSNEELGSVAIVKKAIAAKILKDNKEEKTITYGVDNILILDYFTQKVNPTDVAKKLESDFKEILEAITDKVS